MEHLISSEDLRYLVLLMIFNRINTRILIMLIKVQEGYQASRYSDINFYNPAPITYELLTFFWIIFSENYIKNLLPLGETIN